MPLFDKTIDALSQSLDLQLMRHSVITDNIANAETPGFKARRVEFENELQAAVDESDENGGDVPQVTPEIFQDPDSGIGQDLNTVDMDREMAKLTKTEVLYSAETQAVSQKFALLKYAIGEGER